MPLNTDIALLVRALQTGSTDMAALTAPHAKSFGTSWSSGVGASQADLVWGDTRTLGASATEDLDLSGTLAGALGGTVVFARIKLILVTADAANTNNVILGGHATAAWVGPFGAAAHTLAVKPGDPFYASASGATAWPVTAGTGDLLKIANSGAGTGVTYDILLVGASA